ncbi:MAG: carbamate kinase [Desulfurococcales archaeon]|nr:carbamate kinase [Desulfurococcales archaeon]
MSGQRDERYILIALGGNAFQSKGEPGTPENYWRNAYRAAETIVKIVKEGYKVAITHGNGPQVGIILEWMERSKDKIPPMTMDIAGAMTQGWLGYLLMQAIYNTLIKEGVQDRIKGVVAIVNQVAVSKDDPAWKNPTKYVGSYYTEEEAKKLMKEKGWVIKPDPRGGWRRVVPSPNPVENVEAGAVRKLLDEGWIVIASGGGGIPVIRNEDGTLQGAEAVIDKDLAGEVLATGLGVGTFVILTDVEGVYLNFGKPDQKLLEEVTVSELERYYKEGHFKPGSMGPKVLAVIRFLKHGGKKAMIGHLHKGYEVIKGLSGTRIYPD